MKQIRPYSINNDQTSCVEDETNNSKCVIVNDLAGDIVVQNSTELAFEKCDRIEKSEKLDAIERRAIYSSLTS
ncbi:hypothetical protein ACFL16_00110 [Patescibacteria group bacterium]